MHRSVKCLAIATLFTLAAAEARAAPPASKPGSVRACSLLPKGEVKRLLAHKDWMPKDEAAHHAMLFDTISPGEEPLGGGGSFCGYSGVRIQVDPFTWAKLEELRKASGSTWSAVAGVGDAAYTGGNARAGVMELYARTERHVFTIQMDVPAMSPGRPAISLETLRPIVIALGKAVAAKLH